MIAPETRAHLRSLIKSGTLVVSIAAGDLSDLLDATEPSHGAGIEGVAPTVTIDPARYGAIIGGKFAVVTGHASTVLRALASAHGALVTYDSLLSRMFPQSHGGAYCSIEVLRVTVKNLRKRFVGLDIKNIRGEGYRLCNPVTPRTDDTRRGHNEAD